MICQTFRLLEIAERDSGRIATVRTTRRFLKVTELNGFFFWGWGRTQRLLSFRLVAVTVAILHTTIIKLA